MEIDQLPGNENEVPKQADSSVINHEIFHERETQAAESVLENNFEEANNSNLLFNQSQLFLGNLDHTYDDNCDQ